MERNISLIIGYQIIVTLVIVLLIYLFLRSLFNFHYEKRFSKYSLSPKSDNQKSFFDNIFDFYWKLNHKFGDMLLKSKGLVDYSKKYEKHITYEQKDLVRPIDYIVIKIIISLVLFILCMITYIIYPRSFTILSILLIIVFGFYLPDLVLRIIYNNKRKCVEEDLLKAIIIMNNAFKSGMNILEASEMVKNELSGPISDEFKKICVDLKYGLSLEIVFNRFYERVKLDDAKYITSSLTLLNKTGGNIVKVFSMIEASFFDKKKLKHELRSMTSQSVFVYRLLIVLPPLFSGIIFIFNNTYFNPFFKNPIGIIVLGIIVLLYILYIIVIKKIMEVKI